MIAKLNQTRISPKKASLVAGLIVGKNVKEAQNILTFTPKKGAEVLLKALKSAVANAENNFNQKAEDLIIAKIQVAKGTTYKRFMPVSRGRAHPILKRTSNITLEVVAQKASSSKKSQ